VTGTRPACDQRWIFLFRLTEAARRHVAGEGLDPVYGARPLRRHLQREIETRIGRALLGGEVTDGSTVTVDYGRPAQSALGDAAVLPRSRTYALGESQPVSRIGDVPGISRCAGAAYSSAVRAVESNVGRIAFGLDD
jgi:hypothetical protein